MSSVFQQNLSWLFMGLLTILLLPTYYLIITLSSVHLDITSNEITMRLNAVANTHKKIKWVEFFWMKALCFIEQADGEFHQNRCLFFGTLAKITLIDVCQLSQHKKAHNLETFYISPSIHWIPF